MKHIGTTLVISLALAGCDTSGGAAPSKDSPAANQQGAVQAQPAQQAAPPKAKGPFPESKHPAMKDPSQAKEQAPEAFDVKFETTMGDFTIQCTRAWAPNGVDRLYNLVKIGFFDDVAFFRTVKGFVTQFGIHGNPEVSAIWGKANIAPDPVKEKNVRGMVTYAMAGSPDTRSSQLFINFKDNTSLDRMGFAPICKVSSGMDVVDKLYDGYGETAGRDQGNINKQGNPYLRQRYPLLDYIKTARIGADGAKPADSATADAAEPAPAASAEPAPAASAAPAPAAP